MKYHRLFLTLGLLLLPLLNTGTQHIPLSQGLALTAQQKNPLFHDEVMQTQFSSPFSPVTMYINHAYYYDLDFDGVEDDVLTIITIETVSGNPLLMINDVFEYLTLPSGLTYYVSVSIQGNYNHVLLIIEWFNVATETGWYDLLVCVDCYCLHGYYYLEDSLEFDPPDSEGPDGAMPRAEVSLG
jgi:hypothetical protein